MTHILITGANRGIGLGFVRKYIGKNLHLTCTTRDISGSKELVAFKEKYPNNMEIFELDLLKENAAVTLANFIKDRPIDILISNAGVGSSNQHFQAVSSNQWLEVLKVNFINQVYLTQFIVKKMSKAKSSSIVNVSSSSVYQNPQGRLSYSASKSALISATKTMSKELARYNIRCNAICPGLTNTDMRSKGANEEYLKNINHRGFLI